MTKWNQVPLAYLSEKLDLWLAPLLLREREM